VMLEVATAYFDALRADARREIARGALERARAQRELAQARIKAGAELRTAFLQAELDVARAERQILDADAQARLAREILAVLCGTSAEVALAQPGPQGAPADLKSALAEAEAARADVMDAQKSLEAAELDLGATRRRLWPNLGLVAQASNTQPASLFSDTFNWSAVLTLTVPLYQGGGEYLDIQDKESAITVARHTLEQRRKKVRDEVLRAYTALDTARRQVEIIERQVLVARENHGLVSAQFKAGAVRPTDVTLAQIELANAEDQRVVAAFDREVAAVTLRAAMGALSRPAKR
jgi:outer membrane protein